MKRGVIRMGAVVSILWIGIVVLSLTPRVGLGHEKEAATPRYQLAQAECIHTYRIPGCEGGRECVRREVVPCEIPEPSLQQKIQRGVEDAAEGVREYFGEEDSEPEPRGTHFGVRG